MRLFDDPSDDMARRVHKLLGKALESYPVEPQRGLSQPTSAEVKSANSGEDLVLQSEERREKMSRHKGTPQPHYGRGLDHEDTRRASVNPDFARGLDHDEPSDDMYSTDYARGLDNHERVLREHIRPDFAEGSRKIEGS